MNGQPARVVPMLNVDSVDKAREFYIEKLGFDHAMGVVGNDGSLDFCTVILGGGRIMLSRATSPVPSKPSAEFYFEVDDVDGYHEKVVAAGLSPSSPEDMWWGDRMFIVEDLNGYRIWFHQMMRDPAPPQGMKIV